LEVLKEASTYQHLSMQHELAFLSDLKIISHHAE